MSLRPVRKIAVGSGNGNVPRVNLKIGLIQLDVQVEDKWPLARYAVAIVILVYWLKSRQKKVH